MSGPPPLDTTLGALLIGGVLSTFLFGIISMQAYNYARDYSKDPTILRVSVLMMWVFELAQTVLSWQAIYKLAVTFDGPTQGEHFIAPPQSLYLTLLFSQAITTMVQIFYANRIRLFSGRWFIPVITWILACLAMVFAIAMVVILIMHDTVLILQTRFRWLMATSLAIVTAADFLIAISMVYWLWHVRSSGFQKTKTIADTLITWCLESTIIKSVPNMLQLILFMTRNDLLWIIFYLMKASLFSNSMLASLNGRKRMASTDENSSGPTFINLNPTSPGLGPQAAIRSRNVVIQMTRMTETHMDRSGPESVTESKADAECA